METKAKKETSQKKDDTKAKAETKTKDVAESKADTKNAKTTANADDTKNAKTTANADNAKNNKTTANAEKKEEKKQAEMEGKEFREFFIDELKDILWAEKALLKALPKMGKAATGKELAASFEKHLSETESQIGILEQAFELMGEKPKTKKCDAMEGLISESESIISDTDKGSAIRDAGLILAAQKIEHYEIATYGTLAALADAMEEPKIAKLLRSVLRDEKASDKALTALALESVNQKASEE